LPEFVSPATVLPAKEESPDSSTLAYLKGPEGHVAATMGMRLGPEPNGTAQPEEVGRLSLCFFQEELPDYLSHGDRQEPPPRLIPVGDTERLTEARGASPVE